METSGPVSQPERGVCETMAVVTGPGDITAPIAIEKEKRKIARGEVEGSMMADFNTRLRNTKSACRFGLNP